MNNIVVLMLGDPSGDGHGKKETITIRSNLTHQEMLDAYDIGAKIIEVDVINEIAADYEDNTVTKKQYDAFTKHGYKFFLDQDQQKDVDDDENICIWRDEYVQMFYFTVKLGNPEFDYQEILGEDINIGGYGLF